MIDKDYCGFINIIKPTGMTSFDVIKKVKKILNIKRVGHLGTLDPAASGVLPIAVGKATKFFDYFLSKDKVYYAYAKFGVETDTLDSFGKVTKTQNVTVDEQELKEKIKKFIGKQTQIPPKYSAIKIDGKKAYEKARNDEEFEIKPRQIEIFDLKVVKQIDENLFLIRAHTSSGTYIRTLVSDIAKSLNTIAITPVIIRTKSGVFDNDSAVTLSEFESNPKVIKVEDVLYKLPIYEISAGISKKILNGVKISKDELLKNAKCIKNTVNINKNEEFFIKNDDRIVGLYKIYEDKILNIVFL